MYFLLQLWTAEMSPKKAAKIWCSDASIFICPTSLLIVQPAVKA
jgi:hypothetical protein